MLVPMFLGSVFAGKNSDRVTKSHGRKLTHGHNSTTEIHITAILVLACEFYPMNQIVIQFVEVRHWSEDLHSCSVFHKFPQLICL